MSSTAPVINRTYEFAQSQWRSLFPSAKPRQSSALELAGLLALYALGLFLWRYFLNGGDIPLELHDWAEVSAPRYAFLKDAVTRGALPLHMPGYWALRNVTDRFISVADTNLAPQVLLLRWLEVGEFFLVNTLILYSAGFIGLLLLRRKFDLSFLSVAALHGLLLFNGHISSHLTVGHANWPTLLLLPYFAYLILWLFDDPPRWRWVAWFALWMLAIALNGAFHLYVVTLIFMALLLLSYTPQRRTVLLGTVFSLAVCAVRLLPPILEVAKFDTEFLSGYTTVTELIASFVWLREPTAPEAFAGSLINPLGWWEKDFYLGAIGFGFVLVFGPLAWIKGNPGVRRYLPLAFPIGAVTILSVGRLYRLVGLIGFPLLDSQRVATRLIVLPITLLVVVAVLAFEHTMREHGGRVTRLLAAAGLALLAHDLWQHLRLWRVVNMLELFPPKPLDLSLNIVANRPDPPYELALALGAAMSLISLTALIALARRDRSDATRSPWQVG